MYVHFTLFFCLQIYPQEDGPHERAGVVQYWSGPLRRSPMYDDAIWRAVESELKTYVAWTATSLQAFNMYVEMTIREHLSFRRGRLSRQERLASPTDIREISGVSGP